MDLVIFSLVHWSRSWCLGKNGTADAVRAMPWALRTHCFRASQRLLWVSTCIPLPWCFTWWLEAAGSRREFASPKEPCSTDDRSQGCVYTQPPIPRRGQFWNGHSTHWLPETPSRFKLQWSTLVTCLMVCLSGSFPYFLIPLLYWGFPSK